MLFVMKIKCFVFIIRFHHHVYLISLNMYALPSNVKQHNVLNIMAATRQRYCQISMHVLELWQESKLYIELWSEHSKTFLCFQNGEFSFENVQQITQKGFNIDPQKVSIDSFVATHLLWKIAKIFKKNYWVIQQPIFYHWIFNNLHN